MGAERIAVLGGTFNPIHNAHLFLADAFYHALQLSRVLVIPTGVPPHKAAPDLASGRDRLEMCRLAVQDRPYCQVSDMELAREGKSYTVETLRTLHGEYPEAGFYFIMGADMFLTLDHWYRAEEILALATVCAAPRDEVSAARLNQHAKKLESMGGSACILKEYPPDISSTQVRTLLRQGKSVKGLVPEAVEEYIKNKQIYR